MMARRLSGEARRALEILANRPDGGSEDLLLFRHSFKRQILAALLRSGLAAAEREVVETGDKTIEVVRLKITAAAGRRSKAEERVVTTTSASIIVISSAPVQNQNAETKGRLEGPKRSGAAAD